MPAREFIETVSVLSDGVVRVEFEEVEFACDCGWFASVERGESVPFMVLSQGLFLGRCPSCDLVSLAASDDLPYRWWATGRDATPAETSPTVRFADSVAYDDSLSDDETVLAVCSDGHLTRVGTYAGAVIRRNQGEYGSFRTLDETISLDESLVVSGAEPGYITCTECDEARQITTDGLDANDEGHHIITLHSGQTTPYRQTRRVESSMCPTCGNYNLSDVLDKHEGPDAPAVGYEYYECDVCGDKHRPDAIITAGNDLASASH